MIYTATGSAFDFRMLRSNTDIGKPQISIQESIKALKGAEHSPAPLVSEGAGSTWSHQN